MNDVLEETVGNDIKDCDLTQNSESKILDTDPYESDPEHYHLPTVDELPDADQELRVYVGFSRQLSSKELILDMKLGWLAWFRGKLLSLAQESKLVDVTFEEIYTAFGYKRSTAYHYRAIAEKYPDAELVQHRTQTELRNQFPVDDSDLDGENGNDVPPKKTGKGGGPRVVRVTQDNLTKKLQSIVEILDLVTTMERAPAKAPKSYDTHQAMYKNALDLLREAEGKIPAARAELKARHDLHTGGEV